MHIGTFNNIDIRISRALIALIIVYIIAGYGMDIAIVFLIMILHEMGHVVCARALQLNVNEINLLPFGGAVTIQSFYELNPRHEILVSAAGPCVNIIAVLICLSLNQLTGQITVSEDFIKYNLVLGGFNILPALPLDGGRMLRAFLSKEIGFKKATRTAVYGGIVLALFLVMTGLYAIYYNIFNPVLFITAGFLAFSAIKENRNATYLFLKDITYKRNAIIKEGAMQIKEVVVLYNVPLKKVYNKFSAHRYHRIKVVDEQFRIIGTLTEEQLLDAMIKRGLNSPVSNALRK